MTESAKYLLYKVDGGLMRAFQLDENMKAINPKSLYGCYGIEVKDGQVVIELRTTTITYPLNEPKKSHCGTILFELIGGN